MLTNWLRLDQAEFDQEVAQYISGWRRGGTARTRSVGGKCLSPSQQASERISRVKGSTTSKPATDAEEAEAILRGKGVATMSGIKDITTRTEPATAHK